MSMVLDNSCAIPWVIAEESDADALALSELVSSRGAVVPPLFFAEFANVLLKAVRRRRITSEEQQAGMEFVGNLPLETDHLEPTSSVLVYLGERYGLSGYDAWYLYLAISRGLPLATRDTALREAAKSIGIGLVDA